MGRAKAADLETLVTTSLLEGATKHKVTGKKSYIINQNVDFI